MIQREGFFLPGFHGFTSGPHLLPTAAGTSGSVPPRCPPPSLSLADTPHLARHQLIAAFTGCRLAQCGVAQRNGNQTKHKHNRNPSCHTFALQTAAVSRVTHRCQTFLDSSFVCDALSRLVNQSQVSECTLFSCRRQR